MQTSDMSFWDTKYVCDVLGAQLKYICSQDHA